MIKNHKVPKKKKDELWKRGAFFGPKGDGFEFFGKFVTPETHGPAGEKIGRETGGDPDRPKKFSQPSS